ncbi:TPA: helix-turn-helix transcriptional regulator, partial [Salmonella enterica subsp. enterica serovar Saintpaul]|nr:helix-turn-helix transcriptional regulator [Salmonella enterica subsp. enterica serovar Typhimurium]EHO3496803.1 helix-turn-helix transcriptional regulator [Salmonella enterica subsp. enterica serovar Enteritidis]
LFTGRLANSKRGRTLNYTEFILLKRFVSGISIQQIVNIDNIDIKKLYVHKLRLENKLGHSIHKIISNIL